MAATGSSRESRNGDWGITGAFWWVASKSVGAAKTAWNCAWEPGQCAADAARASLVATVNGSADLVFTTYSTISAALLGGYCEFKGVDLGNVVLPVFIAGAFTATSAKNFYHATGALGGFSVEHRSYDVPEYTGKMITYKKSVPPPEGIDRITTFFEKVTHGFAYGAMAGLMMYGCARHVESVLNPESEPV